MKFTDYILLAYTKVRTRKLRSVLTMFATSVLVTFLLVGSFSFTGIRNSIENAAPPGLRGKHIAVEEARNFGPGLSQEGERATGSSGIQSSSDELLYTSKVRPFNPIATHTHTNLNGDFWNADVVQEECKIAQVSLFGGSSDSLSRTSCVTAAVRSDDFFKYLVSEDHAGLVDSSEVPVLISNQYALGLASRQFKDADTPEQRIEKVAKAKQEVLGAQFNARYRLSNISEDVISESIDGDEITIPSLEEGGEESFGETQTVALRVVGVIPDSSIIKELAGVTSFSVDNAAIVFSESQSTELIRQQVDAPNKGQVIRLTEFADVDALTRYVDSGCEGVECWNTFTGKIEHNYFTDYGRAIERTFSQAWGFLRWVVLIWGIGVGLSMMSTTAKVIVDSRKEIGVFRAIGAKRRQIFGVYAVYVTMLAVVSIAVSLLIARLISNFQNNKWADDISVQIALLNGSSEPRGHFSFFGIDPVHLLGITMFVVLVALLGAAVPVVRNLRKDPLRYLRED